MKLNYTALTFFFALFSAAASAQVDNPRYRELVVEMQGLDSDKRIAALMQLLQQNSNDVRLHTLCAAQSWLLLQITEDALVTNEDVEALMKPLGFPFLIKTGATQKELEAACNGEIIRF